MRYSGVGGQAVMEGIMMRNGDKYAVAVRKQDKEIDVQVFDYKNSNEKLKNIPLVRGVVNFVVDLEPINVYDPKCPGAIAYKTLTEEFLKKQKKVSSK